MFLGHYSVAFAARTERNKIPLWVLFVAVQLLDLLWAPFVFLGLKKVRIVLGIPATSPLDLYYMPYTHSLIGESFEQRGINRDPGCVLSLDPGFDCSSS
jgi:hypothetical protein